ncbi:MAG TPA: nucleotidyltransferase domain-containing protein [Flavobacteriaceae bacterium]|nr:nucleotidyltransferase domain-containing protein [Flavobacteriaceae bacterium]
MLHLQKNTTSNFGLSEEIISLLQNVFDKFPEIEKVKIFGSRAMGNYKSGSDIDLAFFAKNFSHNDFLNLQLAVDDIELLYKIDLLNYLKINRSELKKHIDTKGVEFYRKPI